MNAVQGSYKPWFQQIQFKIYDAKAAPQSVKVGGSVTQNFQYDSAHKMVTVTVPFAPAGMKVEVNY